MPRYAFRPKQSDVDWTDYPLEPELTVWDDGPVNTGLLDKHGNPIYRLNDPIGYIHD